MDDSPMSTTHNNPGDAPEVCDFVKTILDLGHFSLAALREHMASCDPACPYHLVCRSVATDGIIQIDPGRIG